MDYKEKYETALEGIQEILSSGQDSINMSRLQLRLQGIFPELKESEDERIRRVISDILLIDSDEIREILDANNVLMQDIDAWLEKQGGQKSTDKIQIGKEYMCIASPRYSTFMTGKIYKPEDKFLCNFMNFCSDCFEPIEESKPKFKVGDWIVRKDGGVFLDGRKFAQITKIEGEKHWFDTAIIYLKSEDIRLWTLEDAEDGDILYSKEHNLLWRYKNTKECYCCMNLNYSNNISIGNEIVIPNDVRPATQEQRDLLFDKMLQYTMSEINDKKELKEIETKFHEGDWVIGVATEFKPMQIVEVLTSGYKTSNGGWIGLSFECGMHLWTIADAKDGDVLVASDGSIFIFAGVVDYACKYYAALTLYNGLSINKEVELDSWELANHVHPATKEQRDLLFAKMGEKGYKWVNEKKELIRRI